MHFWIKLTRWNNCLWALLSPRVCQGGFFSQWGLEGPFPNKAPMSTSKESGPASAKPNQPKWLALDFSTETPGSDGILFLPVQAIAWPELRPRLEGLLYLQPLITTQLQLRLHSAGWGEFFYGTVRVPSRVNWIRGPGAVLWFSSHSSGKRMVIHWWPVSHPLGCWPRHWLTQCFSGFPSPDSVMIWCSTVPGFSNLLLMLLGFGTCSSALALMVFQLPQLVQNKPPGLYNIHSIHSGFWSWFHKPLGLRNIHSGLQSLLLMLHPLFR